MKVSPSILACDFAILKEEIELVSPYCEYIHIDVMDGIFVNNITIGIPVVESLRKYFKNVFDVHLMIQSPLKYIKAFANAGSDIITFHYEAEDDVFETIKEIKKYGKKPGLSIRPNTSIEEIKVYLEELSLVLVMSVEPGFGGQSFMPNSLEKIKELKKIRIENGYDYEIEVDGGINDKNIYWIKEAGADVVVAGSYIFNAIDKAEMIKKLKE